MLQGALESTINQTFRGQLGDLRDLVLVLGDKLAANFLVILATNLFNVLGVLGASWIQVQFELQQIRIDLHSCQQKPATLVCDIVVRQIYHSDFAFFLQESRKRLNALCAYAALLEINILQSALCLCQCLSYGLHSLTRQRIVLIERKMLQ